MADAFDSPTRGVRKVRIPTRSVLADEVYAAVKEHLIDHRVAPGSRIVIDHLAAELGVSPTPVREALARLEADQLVTKEAHRGYTVAPELTIESFVSLFELRLVCEPAAARFAAERASAVDHRALTLALERMAKADSGMRYREYRQFLENDAAFHDAVARASHNEYLVEAIARLRVHQTMARLFYGRGIFDRSASHAEHTAIYDAIASGNGTAAEHAMRDHLARVRDELRTLLADTGRAGGEPEKPVTARGAGVRA